MLLIALRNLFGEHGRFLITVGGVMFSALLILVMLGLYHGWTLAATRFIDTVPADVWVGQSGTGDLSHSVSVLPAELETQIKQEATVREVIPMFGRTTKLSINGKDQMLYMIGVDDSGRIRPSKVVEGSSIPGPGEIIVDTAFTRPSNVKLGDTIRVAEKDLTVAGISSGGNRLMYSFALANQADVQKLFGMQTQPIVSYFLVTLNDPDRDVQTLKDAFPNLGVMTRQEILDTNATLIMQKFLPIIQVVALIALAIGIAVIGLTIYTATIEKSREYGVLKAIGYSNGQLFGIALIQSMTAGVIGFVLALSLAPLLEKLGVRVSEGFMYNVGYPEVASVGAIVLVMSMLAALLPLRRLVSIDPASVFRT